MIDREKVIKGLECCIITPDICSDVCPYFGKCDENDYCDEKLFKDALALLKAQAPRLMTLGELTVWDGTFLIEVRACDKMVWASWYDDFLQYGQYITRMVNIDGAVNDQYKELYGHGWRCWTARPTDEQRKKEPWET